MDCVTGADHGILGHSFWLDALEHLFFPDRIGRVVHCWFSVEGSCDHADPYRGIGRDDHRARWNLMPLNRLEDRRGSEIVRRLAGYLSISDVLCNYEII